jgi:microsomal dipeptidase-like Zn-dependent dipeptidase
VKGSLILVDLHAHFPMHLLVAEQQHTHDQVRRWWRRQRHRRLLGTLSYLAAYRGPGRRTSVTEALMREGDVGVALSVLYQPFNEMDLSRPYGAPPRQDYFEDLVAQHAIVEQHVGEHHTAVTIAHSIAELEQSLTREAPILVHALEGGFALGAEPDEIVDNVERLAAMGIAYVTLAHLFFRDVATNAPALPFVPDWLYRRSFPQPLGEGLTEIGHDIVEALLDHGILIDLTHMSAASRRDVLAVLDERDPTGTVPVLATHAACRFGGLDYALDDATIAAIARRGGVIGCTLSKHYLTSGLGPSSRTLEGSVGALCRHIDRIRRVTGGDDNVAIGTDLDGYIQPPLPELEHMGQMGSLQKALRERYGETAADKICHGNALRVLRDGWGRSAPD